MNDPDRLFETPLQIASDEGDRIWISGLERDYAAKHAAALTKIHNIIPFVIWTESDLLSDEIGPRTFHLKWQLSLLLTKEIGEPVGFLVSYLRPPDGNFEYASIYMHRMAIVPALQRRGIGRRTISIYLRHVFSRFPVDYITLQANDTYENIRIIRLYETLGFKKIKHVYYPDKTDWLMACTRRKS